MRKMTMRGSAAVTAILLAGSLLTACGLTRQTAADPQTTEVVTEAETETEKGPGKDAIGENLTTPEATEETETAEETDAYQAFVRYEFVFSSGAGGWSTDLTIAKDGSFTGVYSDIDLGDSGDDYPYGTEYYCSFSGKFGPLEQVDELTYRTTIQEISYEKEAGTEEIIDGEKYVYSEAYGLDKAEDIYFYMEGTPVANLSEELVSWIQSSLYDYDTDSYADVLTGPVLYNEAGEEGFSSYDLVETALNDLENYETTDEILLASLDEATTQLDMNQLEYQRYDSWDYYLNEVWKALKAVKTDEEMETLTAEEKEWIASRDAAMEEAGSECEGGSMEPMVEYAAGAELTKERACELVELLK